MIDLTPSVVVAAITSLGLTGAALWAAGQFLGEKLFGHWLEGRLQRQKEAHELKLEEFKGAQNKELEKLKGAQNEQIEELRADINHLLDRGKHSNEREYAALTEIWEKFVDMYYATRFAISGSFQYPDLERMSESALASFLETEDALTKEQRAAVVDADNKNGKFLYFVNTNSIIKAQHSYYDFKHLIEKRGIFILKSLKEQFEQAAELCSAAIVQRYVERNGPKLTSSDDLEFQQKGPSALEALKDAVRERLLYGDRDLAEEPPTGNRKA